MPRSGKGASSRGTFSPSAMRVVCISAMIRNSTISKPWRVFRAWRETLAVALLGFVLAGVASGSPAEPASCRTVRMSDVGWTDVTATTALLTQVLCGLGFVLLSLLLLVSVFFVVLLVGF